MCWYLLKMGLWITKLDWIRRRINSRALSREAIEEAQDLSLSYCLCYIYYLFFFWEKAFKHLLSSNESGSTIYFGGVTKKKRNTLAVNRFIFLNISCTVLLATKKSSQIEDDVVKCLSMSIWGIIYGMDRDYNQICYLLERECIEWIAM